MKCGRQYVTKASNHAQKKSSGESVTNRKHFTLNLLILQKYICNINYSPQRCHQLLHAQPSDGGF